MNEIEVRIFSYNVYIQNEKKPCIFDEKFRRLTPPYPAPLDALIVMELALLRLHKKCFFFVILSHRQMFVLTTFSNVLY